MAIGEKIKFYRKANKMTQKKLSELTGIHEVTIRQYEAGKYNPKMINVQKIASVFNVPISELLEMPMNDEMLKTLSIFPSARIEEKDGKKVINYMNLEELYPFLLLNSKGKKKALSYINDLTKLPEYTEDEPPTEK